MNPHDISRFTEQHQEEHLNFFHGLMFVAGLYGGIGFILVILQAVMA